VDGGAAGGAYGHRAGGGGGEPVVVDVGGFLGEPADSDGRAGGIHGARGEGDGRRYRYRMAAVAKKRLPAAAYFRSKFVPTSQGPAEAANGCTARPSVAASAACIWRK